jgi:hypothetical protein
LAADILFPVAAKIEPPRGEQAMQAGKMILFGAAMLALGYLAGAAGLFDSRTAFAQPDDAAAAAGPGKDAENKIRNVQNALQEAMEQLRQDSRYNTITDGVNSFLILCGGGDALQDLESGNGVDPETFAALYAGKATPEIKEQLGTDDEGRLTFHDKPITIYSRKRLERLYAERLRIKDAGI